MKSRKLVIMRHFIPIALLLFFSISGFASAAQDNVIEVEAEGSDFVRRELDGQGRRRARRALRALLTRPHTDWHRGPRMVPRRIAGVRNRHRLHLA